MFTTGFPDHAESEGLSRWTLFRYPESARFASLAARLITLDRTIEHIQQPLNFPAGLDSGRNGRPFLNMCRDSPPERREVRGREVRIAYDSVFSPPIAMLSINAATESIENKRFPLNLPRSLSDELRIFPSSVSR